MKAEYAANVVNVLVADLLQLATDMGLAELPVKCLCRARTLQDLIQEELDNRKAHNAARDARQHAAGRKKGGNGGLGRGRKAKSCP